MILNEYEQRKKNRYALKNITSYSIKKKIKQKMHSLYNFNLEREATQKREFHFGWRED